MRKVPRRLRRPRDRPGAGLTPDEATQRLTRHGPNLLAFDPAAPGLAEFLDKFRNVLVMVLLGAVVLDAAIGDIKDAIVILIVVVFNAALGFYQEHRAEATLAALKKCWRSTPEYGAADGCWKCRVHYAATARFGRIVEGNK